jgi:hypothetical protein
VKNVVPGDHHGAVDPEGSHWGNVGSGARRHSGGGAAPSTNSPTLVSAK